MRILIVEDEPLNAFLLQLTLEDAGHEVLGPFSDAESALAKARVARPDLALVDIRLGGAMLGTELARILTRELELPVVLASGQVLEAHAARQDAVGFLGKPYSLRTVIEALDVVVAVHRGQPPQMAPAGLQLFSQAA